MIFFFWLQGFDIWTHVYDIFTQVISVCVLYYTVTPAFKTDWEIGTTWDLKTVSSIPRHIQCIEIDLRNKTEFRTVFHSPLGVPNSRVYFIFSGKVYFIYCTIPGQVAHMLWSGISGRVYRPFYINKLWVLILSLVIALLNFPPFIFRESSL